MEEHRTGRGGKRPGSGRKAKGRVPMYIAVCPEALEWAKAQGNRSEYVERLILSDKRGRQ